MLRAFAAIVAAVLALLPQAALACAVCGFNEDESRTAYIATTVALSVLPLAFIAGVIVYFRRHHKRHVAALAATRAPEREALESVRQARAS